MALDVDECLRTLVHSEGSDLHLKVDAPPMARIDGSLRPLEDREPLAAEDTEGALRKLLSDDRTREEFAADGEADFSYSLAGVSRFRVNAFRQRGAVSIVCRAIPFQVRTIEDLGLPPAIRNLADEKRGIVLLTGTTGSGKSTTLAAMIDHINSNYAQHVITLEDPIEYLHRDKRSIINQREVGSDTIGFGRAMKRVLRQDPDVILVGEMRDEETVRTALSAAETGHLVLSTLHTLDATETINRIIDFFPPHLQQQARVMLASTLRGAVSQRLVPTSDGQGRVAASEIMVVTGRIQDLILNPNETGKISQVIAEGEYYGMRTFDQALLEKVTAGEVDKSVAMEYASSPHDFKLMLASAGKAASDMSQLDDDSDEVAPPPPAADVVRGVEEPVEPDPEPTPVAPAPVAAAPAAAEAPIPDPPAPTEPPAIVPSAAPEAPVTAPVAEIRPAPEADSTESRIEYGSAEHAFGRSAGEPSSEADEHVEGGEGPADDAGAPAEGSKGLGHEEYAEIWSGAEDGEPDSEQASPPAGEDRLAEFTPEQPPPPAGEDRLAEFRPEGFERPH